MLQPRRPEIKPQCASSALLVGRRFVRADLLVTSRCLSIKDPVAAAGVPAGIGAHRRSGFGGIAGHRYNSRFGRPRLQ